MCKRVTVYSWRGKKPFAGFKVMNGLNILTEKSVIVQDSGTEVLNLAATMSERQLGIHC